MWGSWRSGACGEEGREVRGVDRGAVEGRGERMCARGGRVRVAEGEKWSVRIVLVSSLVVCRVVCGSRGEWSVLVRDSERGGGIGGRRGCARSEEFSFVV